MRIELSDHEIEQIAIALCQRNGENPFATVEAPDPRTGAYPTRWQTYVPTIRTILFVIERVA